MVWERAWSREPSPALRPFMQKPRICLWRVARHGATAGTRLQIVVGAVPACFDQQRALHDCCRMP